ncbi:uncharacterized protein PITG_21292 [Phytophthora infestans T30-4]|uniref:Sugar phosphate phosphatase n=1 Tax=Phytophthora infestans (strain T30-4) TaxID=403677 RepID=D0P466_PHYIT|nr:uncharacterized protein PITG_21292 [Phytophthora infestans T30-4]EEY63283.1 conserved hypothetical protein [Phytophthora infestans T30-4]|eukprot:XP_002894906.1 conserved hypothetical protein [Phytophthora infestans T30-4]
MSVSDEYITRVQQLDELVANVQDTFAHTTCTERMPQPADDLVNNAEVPLPSIFPEQAAKSPTSKHWESLLAGKGYRWQNSPWFLVEQYMFHLILLMTSYYSTHFDPFNYSKVAELKGDTPWSVLQAAVKISTQVGSGPQSHRDQFKRFMIFSLWGNKADGTNDNDQVMTFLEQKARNNGAKTLSVEYISDNIGSELLLDLAMADHMLTHNWCGKVTFNVKAEPIYVSDVMAADVDQHILEMQRDTRTTEVRSLGKRLAEYSRNGQIVTRPDTYWNQYTYYWEMPAELQTRVAREATLVVLKGKSFNAQADQPA